jgi:hypothetical protein
MKLNAVEKKKYFAPAGYQTPGHQHAARFYID